MRQFINKTILTLSLILLASLSFADPVWIDVRTPEEYLQDNIEGDLNMPVATINAESLAELFGKNSEINLYCRSGGRAGQVQELLTAAGFSNVNNMGGIDDVRKLREEAAKNASH